MSTDWYNSWFALLHWIGFHRSSLVDLAWPGLVWIDLDGSGLAWLCPAALNWAELGWRAVGELVS